MKILLEKNFIKNKQKRFNNSVFNEKFLWFDKNNIISFIINDNIKIYNINNYKINKKYCINNFFFNYKFYILHFIL